MKKWVLSILLIVFCSCKNSALNKKNNDLLLSSLLYSDSTLNKILQNKDSLNIQVIYTSINRDKYNTPLLHDHFFNVNNSKYFYPASTVKMPAALVALEKLNLLNIDGLNSNTMMDAGNRKSADTTTPGAASVAHYVKEIFLVSDNNAFNSLYEFTGQQYLNETLKKKGYNDTEIRHRLQIALSKPENQSANKIDFYNSNNQLVFTQPATVSNFDFIKRNTLLGNGFMKQGLLVNEPFDFSEKNKASLIDLHTIMRAVIMPETLQEKQRFALTPDDYQLLYRYMSAYPEESINPRYDSSEYYRNYSKFLLFGAEKKAPPPYIRIFNKEGDAYGFLTDIAYVVDFKNNVEFFLSATIYCNSDGIFNDDNYDNDKIGLPFLKQLGQVIYQYELQRKRKYLPNLDKFKMDYSKE